MREPSDELLRNGRLGVVRVDMCACALADGPRLVAVGGDATHEGAQGAH